MDGLNGRIGFEYFEHTSDWLAATPLLATGAVLAFVCSVIHARTESRLAQLVGIAFLVAGIAVAGAAILRNELAAHDAEEQWRAAWTEQIEYVTGHTVDPIALYRLPGTAPTTDGVFMSDVPAVDENGKGVLVDIIWDGRLVTLKPAV